jgi:hypothetical protein
MIKSRSARITFAATASVVGGLLALGASPVIAGSASSEITVTDAYGQWVSPGDRALFLNSPRADYYTPEMVAFELAVRTWVLEEQPEEEFPEFPGYEASPVTVTLKDVGTSNVRGSFSAQVPVELWTFEPGKTSDAAGYGACTDTDWKDDATGQSLGTPTLFAQDLKATWAGKDNDFSGAGPRSNVWGGRVSASLTGPDGTTDLRFMFRQHTQGCTDDGCHVDTYNDHWTIQQR